MPDFISFLVEHKQILLTLHFLGIALGLGGATATDILFFNFLKDFTITRKEADVMRVLSNLIVGGLVLLFLSGVLLFFTDIPRYHASAPFIAKMILVMIITFNGMLLHKYIAPHMVHLSFKKVFQKKELHHKRKIAFALGATSFTSWYFVFFLSMLKRMLPESATSLGILSVYGVILVIAIFVSSQIEKQIVSKAQRT